MADQIRPPIPYFGGKYHLLDWILAHLPPHLIYIEPFGGAGSVLLNKPRAGVEVYNDIYEEVVNLFRVLRSPAMREELISQIVLTPFARDEFEWCLDRRKHPPSDMIERARRYMVIARQGFSGMAGAGGRVTKGNWSAQVDTPSGRGVQPKAWGQIEDNLRRIGDRIRGVIIENTTFQDLIPRFDYPHPLIYCDPPYVHETRSENNTYVHEMTNSVHEELADLLHSFQGMVVLSGFHCDLYDNLYADWTTDTFITYATGAPSGKGKKPRRTEVLWLNDLAARMLDSQPGLF